MSWLLAVLVALAFELSGFTQDTSLRLIEGSTVDFQMIKDGKPTKVFSLPEQRTPQDLALFYIKFYGGEYGLRIQDTIGAFEAGPVARKTLSDAAKAYLNLSPSARLVNALKVPVAYSFRTSSGVGTDSWNGAPASLSGVMMAQVRGDLIEYISLSGDSKLQEEAKGLPATAEFFPELSSISDLSCYPGPKFVFGEAQILKAAEDAEQLGKDSLGTANAAIPSEKEARIRDLETQARARAALFYKTASKILRGLETSKKLSTQKESLKQTRELVGLCNQVSAIEIDAKVQSARWSLKQSSCPDVPESALNENTKKDVPPPGTKAKQNVPKKADGAR